MRASDCIYHVPDLESKILFSEMRSGNIDRNASDLVAHVAPHSLISGNMPDHEVIDLGDKAVLFEDGDKPSG